MWNSCRRVLQDLLSLSAVRGFSVTSAQNTIIVERWWQVPLSKVGRPPRLHPRRHRIYKLVEDTKHSPKEKMELILTQTVPKLGGRGDTVFVKKSVGRNKLLAQGLAVYPSPENKQLFAEELRLLREGKPEERIQTRTGQLTAAYLQRSKLVINQMPSEEFKLTNEVVRRQLLKKLGVVAPPHALRLPYEPITELGDYWCEVTINGLDTVRIPMSLVPFEDPSASNQKLLRKQKQQAAADNAAGAEEEVLKVDPAVAVAATAESGFESEASAGGVSSPEEAATPQTSQDTTAPPGDGPKKD